MGLGAADDKCHRLTYLIRLFLLSISTEHFKVHIKYSFKMPVRVTKTSASEILDFHWFITSW